jgi:transcriptional regulator with XRE-family HTH domain
MARKQLVTPRFKPPRRPTFFRQWRKYRELTLEEAAELSGMTPGNISAMERGAQGYTQDGLEKLAKAYDCEPGQLLMVDPLTSDIWSIWENAKVGDRQKIVEISKTIVGKTGT